MIIQCPNCHFQREMPDSTVAPGKKYKVTCPRCAEVFSFSLPAEAIPEDEEKTDRLAPQHEEQSPQASSSDLSGSEQVIEEISGLHSAAKASEPAQSVELQPGDDPLPPGARVVEPVAESALSEKETTERTAAHAPEKAPSKGGILGRWRSVRENLRKYDEAQDSPGTPFEDGRPEGAPWERPEYYGFWGCFTRTVLGVMFRPREFFLHVKCDMSLIRPALFYVLMSIIQNLALRFWSMKALREIMASGADQQTLAMAEALMKSMNLPLALLIWPFLALFQAVFLAGIYHLMFRIVQPNRADFATTMRIVCYSAAPLILCVVPMFGSVIAMGWLVAATFLGCKYALNIPWTRTLLAMLPLFLLELALVSQVSVFMNS